MGGRVGGRAAAGGDTHAEANTPLGCSTAHSSVWRTSASWSGDWRGTTQGAGARLPVEAPLCTAMSAEAPLLCACICGDW